MNADGNIDDGEAAYMNHLRLVIGISENDVQNAHSRGVSDSMLALSLMSDEKKIAVGVMMAEMIRADGDADPKEIMLFNMIHDIIGIPKLNE